MEKTEITYDSLCGIIESCVVSVSYKVLKDRKKMLVVAISEEVRFKKYTEDTRIQSQNGIYYSSADRITKGIGRDIWRQIPSDRLERNVHDGTD